MYISGEKKTSFPCKIWTRVSYNYFCRYFYHTSIIFHGGAGSFSSSHLSLYAVYKEALPTPEKVLQRSPTKLEDCQQGGTLASESTAVPRGIRSPSTSTRGTRNNASTARKTAPPAWLPRRFHTRPARVLRPARRDGRHPGRRLLLALPVHSQDFRRPHTFPQRNSRGPASLLFRCTKLGGEVKSCVHCSRTRRDPPSPFFSVFCFGGSANERFIFAKTFESGGVARRSPVNAARRRR